MKLNLLTTTVAVTLFAISSVFAQFNPQPNWKDSYRANGFCWCQTNYDHGIANKTVTINGTAYGIRAICEELEKHPQYRRFRNGDIPYNDIQCGNGPFNDAPDEPGCPGRVDIGPRGCFQIGPRWDMAWLETRSVFNGSGGGNNGGNDGNADEGQIGMNGSGGNGAGQGPKVSVVFPTLNKRIKAPATIRVEATATDQDGVREVEVKVDGKLVSKQTSAPYVWNNNGQDALLTNLPVKNYFLEVKAVDNKGNSSIVDILVYVIPGDTASESISLSNIPNQSASKNFTFPVQYSAAQQRDIVVEIRNPSNAWLGQGKIKVQAGSGSAQVNVNLPNVATNGSPYKATAQLRPVGATWRDNIKVSVKTFTIDDSDGAPDPTPNPGNNGSVTIKGQSINKYISSEGGTRSMRANRDQAGAQEKFTITSAGNGTVSIKSSNGKYVSSENGGKPMNANRNAVGAWEKFTLVSQGGNVYAIRGNNGKYVSHENGNNGGINCNRGAVGAWEKFVITGLNSNLAKIGKAIFNTRASVYPNPGSAIEEMYLNLELFEETTPIIRIMNIEGKVLVNKSLGVMKSGENSIVLSEFANVLKASGLYLIHVTLGQKTLVKKVYLEN